MKHSILCLALLPVLAGCVTQSQPIRVATYNIRLVVDNPGTPDCWRERKNDLAAQIRRINPDVFGLQEVCPEQMAHLRDSLAEYTFVGDHREADRKSGEASPVAFRTARFAAERSGTFWLSETPDVPASKSWNTCCTRVCSYLILKDLSSGKRFCFANTHTDHISAEAREKGMLLIISRMKEFGNGLPIVFTGDHNCTEVDPPAKAVAKLLDNALYRSETPPQGSWRTWNGWRWTEREVSTEEALKLPPQARNVYSDKDPFYEKCKGPRIDYIYVSPEIRVLEYATVNGTREDIRNYPSDHFPVTAELQLP